MFFFFGLQSPLHIMTSYHILLTLVLRVSVVCRYRPGYHGTLYVDQTCLSDFPASVSER